MREPEFHDASGQPAPLPLEGDDPSFGGLVRRYSGDMPVRAVLDELQDAFMPGTQIELEGTVANFVVAAQAVA